MLLQKSVVLLDISTSIMATRDKVLISKSLFVSEVQQGPGLAPTLSVLLFPGHDFSHHMTLAMLGEVRQKRRVPVS